MKKNINAKYLDSDFVAAEIGEEKTEEKKNNDDDDVDECEISLSAALMHAGIFFNRKLTNVLSNVYTVQQTQLDKNGAYFNNNKKHTTIQRFCDFI